MSKKRRYKFNPETLNYELHKTPVSTKFFKTFLYFLLSLVAFGVYSYLYSNVLGMKTPKHMILAKYTTEWRSKLEMLGKRFDKSDQVLEQLQMRDNIVYRSIFGMEEVSADVRNAGYGGVERFSYLDGRDFSGLLTSTSERLNILTKKAYVQSKSFDDICVMSAEAGEMASCVPNICPVYINHVRYASSFGYRIDPIEKIARMHQGIDLAGSSGEPIFATGNGKVVKIGYEFFGYGNYVIIDHGFGYKTRYAHLKAILVADGQKITRGDQIGEMGSTGRSIGTHLHYEVIYRNNPVNPINYYNSDISSEDYASIVKPTRNSHI